MLTTSRSTTRRLERVSTPDAMAEALRDLRTRQDCVTEDDLKRVGFTAAEIAAHGEAAKSKVRRAELSAAH